MSYKKNQNINVKLEFGEFDSYLSKLNDSFEDSVYTKRSTTWTALCISGFNQQGSSPLVVDLGDGVNRYKVKIKIIAEGVGRGATPPTDCRIQRLINMPEDEMQYKIDLFPFAYTENIAAVPVFDSMLHIEEYDNTYFIKEIIAQSAEQIQLIGFKNTTINNFNNGVQYSNTPLGAGWLPGTTLVSSFGLKVPCSELVNFGRSTPVDFFAYGKNPIPSQATDDLYWKMVIEKLGAVSTPNKIRFFNAWAAKESSQSTNNPFATSHPGGGNTWSKDPNMTAYNWSKPTTSRPGGKAWVRNYSTMEAGVVATVATIRRKGGTSYSEILKKIMEPNAQFPDSWFSSAKVKEQFERWGGSGGDGVGYWAGVMNGYKKNKRRRSPINTNKPGGRSAKCVKKV